MFDPIQEENYKGYTIRMYPDEASESPREWDNSGIIAYKHRDYILGEEEISDPVEWLAEKLGIEDIYALAHKKGHDTPYCDELRIELEVEFCNRYVAFPLFLYDHGIQSIKIGNFAGLLPQGHAHFDSGQVGYIYTTLEHVNRLGLEWKKWSKKRREQAEKWLRSEVDLFDDYVSGQCYGYEVVAPNGEQLDALWGFYGSESFEDMISEAKGCIDYDLQRKIEARTKRAKGYIKNRVPHIYRKLPELV